LRIAIIPARGGSVRIPRKNIREFRGRPMLAYPIEAARASELFDLIVVSTDDTEIEDVALKLGAVVVRRPPDDGERGTQDVAREVLKHFPKALEACVIYATSPLLKDIDIMRGHVLMLTHQSHFAMSVQTDPLADAGCFYWGSAAAFREGFPLIAPHTVMVPLPAGRVCDINTEADWQRAESMFDALRRAS
jgi:N-acylneuraminate cytidylyltransferase